MFSAKILLRALVRAQQRLDNPDQQLLQRVNKLQEIAENTDANNNPEQLQKIRARLEEIKTQLNISSH